MLLFCFVSLFFLFFFSRFFGGEIGNVVIMFFLGVSGVWGNVDSQQFSLMYQCVCGGRKMLDSNITDVVCVTCRGFAAVLADVSDGRRAGGGVSRPHRSVRLVQSQRFPSCCRCGSRFVSSSSSTSSSFFFFFVFFFFFFFFCFFFFFSARLSVCRFDGIDLSIYFTNLLSACSVGQQSRAQGNEHMRTDDQHRPTQRPSHPPSPPPPPPLLLSLP